MRKLLLLGLLLLLFGCQNTEEPNKSTDTPPNKVEDQNRDKEEAKEEVAMIDIELKDLFKPDQSTAYFLGEGNEFATYTEKTTWLSDKYVGIINDNGGSATMNIYRITDDKIEYIFYEHIDVFPIESASYPSIEILETMDPIETYFAKPIEIGTTFDGYTIIDINASIETPLQKFDNVIVIQLGGDDFINRKYFAKGFGEIKNEFISYQGTDAESIVTSTLESLDQ